MPTLVRLLVVIGVLAGIALAAMTALVTFIKPHVHEISETVPLERAKGR